MHKMGATLVLVIGILLAGCSGLKSTTVMVFPDQLSQDWVESGAISIVNENVTVLVAAGQSASVLIGEPPLEPGFRIVGEGQVMQIGAVDGKSGIAPSFSVPLRYVNVSYS